MTLMSTDDGGANGGTCAGQAAGRNERRMRRRGTVADSLRFLAALSTVAWVASAQPRAPVDPDPASAAAPVRVAYLHQGLGMGGVETSILNLCTHIDHARITPAVFLFGAGLGEREALRPEVERTGCTVLSFGVRENYQVAGPQRQFRVRWHQEELGRLVGALRDGHFDVAFTYFGGHDASEPKQVPVGVEAAWLAGIPAQATRVEWQVAVLPNLPLAAVEVSSPYVARLQVQSGVQYPLHFVGSGVQIQPLVGAASNAAGVVVGADGVSMDVDVDMNTASRRQHLPGLGKVRPWPHTPRVLIVGRLSRLVAVKDPMTFVLATQKIHDVLTSARPDG